MSSGITFNASNGVAIPGVGFGTFSNEGAKGQAYKAVLYALRVGYRHLECAWFYGNENEVGQAIREFLEENPACTREDLFITTKVWNHLHRYGDVWWSLEDSLKNFGLSYVDLFLVHWPIAVEKKSQLAPKIGPDGKVFPCTSFPALTRNTLTNTYIVCRSTRTNKQPRRNLARHGSNLRIRQSPRNRGIQLANLRPGSPHQNRKDKTPRQPNRNPPLPPKHQNRRVLPGARHRRGSLLAAWVPEPSPVHGGAGAGERDAEWDCAA